MFAMLVKHNELCKAMRWKPRVEEITETMILGEVGDDE